MTDLSDRETVPLFEEHLHITKKTIEDGKVVIDIRTEEQIKTFEIELLTDTVEVERVSIGRLVDTAPEIRRDGEVTIYPVVEEIFVKRLMLREEVRVTRKRSTQTVAETVTLRRQEAVVQRLPQADMTRNPKPNKATPS